MDEPTRMYTDPNSGARKELKLCRLSLIDPAALHALGSVAGYGATKYGDNNWTGGYPWSHSVDALYRHLLSWQQGNNLDIDLQLHNIIGKDTFSIVYGATVRQPGASKLPVTVHCLITGTEDHPHVTDLNINPQQ